LSSRLFNLACTALLVLASAWLVQLALSSPKSAYLLANVKNLHQPIQYHGQDITADFFEGWYYKMVKLADSPTDPPIQSMAIIPGIYRPGPDNQDKEHAFVIVVGIPGPERAAYFRFPVNAFIDLLEEGNSKEKERAEVGAFRVKIGNSIFAHDEIVLNLPANRFDRVPAPELEEFYVEASRQYDAQLRKRTGTQQSDAQLNTNNHRDYFRGLFPNQETLIEAEDQGPFSVHGHFQFPASTQTPLPTTRWMPSIMGLTAYLPFLECNHGIASLHHTIKKGHILALRDDKDVLGEAKLDGGVGYIEKDWGVNFPSTWVWAQANMFDAAPGSSLLVRRPFCMDQLFLKYHEDSNGRKSSNKNNHWNRTNSRNKNNKDTNNNRSRKKARRVSARGRIGRENNDNDNDNNEKRRIELIQINAS